MPLYHSSDRKRICKPSESDGEDKVYRSAFRRDYGRLVHSAAFRRLQGKTQLFPSHESDFFRNRLTHSIEVAQVAKGIATKLNVSHGYFQKNKLDEDLIEFAALAHDLGHPPFGHNGEEALDECMQDAGGFEGNAQTLRIISKLEKRATAVGDGFDPLPVEDGIDKRTGLNLTFRSLASILKYDAQIPISKKQRDPRHRGPVIGYYYTEADLVAEIRKRVKSRPGEQCRTIECSIMDIADDIAYSTYDLEDAFKGHFLTPALIFSTPEARAKKVCDTIISRAKKYYGDLDPADWAFTLNDFYQTVLLIFSGVFDGFDPDVFRESVDYDDPVAALADMLSTASDASEKLAGNGYYRTRFTSELLKRALNGIEVKFDKERPHLSVARLKIETFREVEVLKNLAFQSVVMSPMLKVAEYRGKEIVKRIFVALKHGEGFMLMPDDFKSLYGSINGPLEKDRVICDFIAGMTNRYAIQFYSRLFGATADSIYQPL